MDCNNGVLAMNEWQRVDFIVLPKLGLIENSI
jgi:hypothetical protein